MAQIGIGRELRSLPHNMQHDSVTIISSNDSSKGNLDESILENTQKIHQASIIDHIPDEMFTTTIFELEPLINIRPVTNISDDINDFEYEITNHNSIPP